MMEKKPVDYGWVELLPRGHTGNSLFVFYLRARDLKTELRSIYTAAMIFRRSMRRLAHSVTHSTIGTRPYKIYPLCSLYHPKGLVLSYGRVRIVSNSDIVKFYNVEPTDLCLVPIMIHSYRTTVCGPVEGPSCFFFFF